MSKKIEFETRIDLAAQLADDVCAKLQAAIDEKGHALLAVSGGSTPKRFFKVLSSTQLDWDKVTITLVDERLVPDTNERSNAQLVQNHLMQNLAISAKFKPLYVEGKSPEETAEFLNQDFADILPIDVAILGMGADAHTASFFPEGSHLAEAIDEKTTALFSPMTSENAGERITFTLPPLLKAKFLALHIEGEEKEMVLMDAQQSLKARDVLAKPIRAILRNKPHLPVYWAP